MPNNTPNTRNQNNNRQTPNRKKSTPQARQQQRPRTFFGFPLFFGS